MNHNEFALLVRELKLGDNECLKAIFLENSKSCIGKLTAHHSCTREDAEDIYTDAVLNFRLKILEDKIEAITDLSGYLYATCRNMLLVKYKKEQRIKTVVFELREEATEDINFSFDSDRELTYKEEIFEITEKALAALPEKCQRLLKAYYFDRLSMKEIGLQMEFANANVTKVSKSRCFQKLVEQVQILQAQKSKKENVAN